MQNAKRQTWADDARPAQLLTPDTRHLTPPSRRGFTLVELLIVITILGILAGLVVGVASVAAQTGRDARTRNIIGRIHTLLIEHYNSYANRRIELGPRVVNAMNALPPTVSAADRGKILAAARLYALREIMVMEIPDRWSDVWLQPLPPAPGGATAVAPLPAYVNTAPADRTPLAQNFLRRCRGLYGRINSLTGVPNTWEEILANQSAECLYMIVTVACGDGEARTMFHENDIGDVDGDGAPEFLDGWGHPISFFRWAPGFNSQIQGNANTLMSPADWEAAAAADHDHYDLFRIDIKAYRLLPLIFSAGRDEQLGIDLFPQEVSWSSRAPLSAGTVYPYFSPPVDPYKETTLTPRMYYGTAIAEGGAADNVHNHTIGRRLAVQR
jgi:prepilin-type N-terminal cleavage/methylation domain-containing protein